MKGTLKKIICATLSAAMVMALCPALSVETAAAVKAPKSVTVTGYKDSGVGLNIDGIPKGSQLDASSVKVAKTSIATVYSVYEDVYTNAVEWDSTGYATIYLKVVDFGTTDVSYKIGSKTYTTKVTIKELGSSDSSGDYTNPIEKLTISGVNSGKDLSSKLKKQSYLEAQKLKASQDDASIFVKAKSGWKVNSIYYCDSYEDGSHSISMYSIDDSSASLDNLKFEKSSKITHQVQLELRKGDNSQYIWIEFK